MSKISITPIVLRNQKPTEVSECYIELFENYLYYHVDFWADEPIINDDPDSGLEQVLNRYDITALKKSISGVEKSLTKDNKWGVYILITGFSNDIRVYFKQQSPAQELFDRIQNWLISIPN